MIITFQVILLLSMVISLIGIAGEKKDMQLRHNLTAVFISATIAFVVSILYL